MAQHSVWAHDTPPAGTPTINAPSTGVYSVGTSFETTTPGQVTAVWYYVPQAGLGTINAEAAIWAYAYGNVADAGDLLTAQTFTLQDTAGWQQVTLTTPVTVPAAGRFTAGISFPDAPNLAYYAAWPGIFTTSHTSTSGVLTALSEELGGNGRLSNQADTAWHMRYPMRNINDSFHGVDVTFSDDGTPPPDPEPVEVNFTAVTHDTAWTVTGTTALTAVTDDDPDTYLEAVDPDGATVTLTVPAIEAPVDGLPIPLSLSSTGGPVTVTAHLSPDGTTWTPTTATPLTVTGGPADHTLTIPQADTTGIDWGTGTAQIRLTITKG